MSNSTTLLMHRSLTAEQAEQLNFCFEQPRLLYETPDGSQGELALEASGTTMNNSFIMTPTDDYDPDTCSLTLVQEFTLSQLVQLFATKDSLLPLTVPSSMLGLVAVWRSTEADISGCTLVSSFKWGDVAHDSQHSFSFRHTFIPGVLRGMLQVRYMLCLQEAGRQHRAGYAHEAGTLLGECGQALSIALDGDGSLFPISTASLPGQPLWWTEINISDPFSDPFTEDYFNIVINEAHPDFSQIEGKGRRGTSGSPLFREIFASALEELLIWLQMNYGSDIEDADMTAAAPGSVAAMVLYLKQTFSIDTTNMRTVHDSVRRIVDEKLQGGTRE